MENKYLWLDEYLLSMPGVVKDYKAEWTWFRYLVGGKMFAATCRPSEKYKEPYAGRELVSLKCDAAESEFLRSQHADIAPGFYMDKRCWVSVFLDGDTPEALLRELCDKSYKLVFSKLTKAQKAEIEAGAKK